jgi:3-oxoacyl-[acyl-carrier protein] reductase
MGYYVLINFKSNQTEAVVTLDLIKEKGGNGELIQFDVASYDNCNEVLGKWLEENNDKFIEVLVNNSGIRQDGLLMWMKREEWQEVIDTNLNGFFNVTRLLVKEMLIKRFGRIINVVSLSGIKGLPGQANYSAAKGGVIAATKALAQEVGKKNVTVNAVAPGFIKTDMTVDINEADHKPMIPLNRFGTADEVAEVICFLASEKSSYITGEVISVNGGLYT